MDGTVLHILNGDHALELWQKCGFEGQSLVWREIYLEGPLPDTEDLSVFHAARAEYLSHFTELSGISQERLCLYLKKLDDSILDLPESSSLMLWFDSCIFDQTILMRILHLVHRKNSGTGKVFLYCCEGNRLTIEDFRKGWQEKVQLQPDDLETAARAWQLFLHKDAAGMVKLAERGNFGRLPKMKKALSRCAEEVSEDKNGLNRTQRQIVQLVAEGCSSFIDIFKGLDAFEEYPFLGDTGCQRQLELLICKGILTRSGDDYKLKR